MWDSFSTTLPDFQTGRFFFFFWTGEMRHVINLRSKKNSGTIKTNSFCYVPQLSSLKPDTKTQPEELSCVQFQRNKQVLSKKEWWMVVPGKLYLKKKAKTKPNHLQYEGPSLQHKGLILFTSSTHHLRQKSPIYYKRTLFRSGDRCTSISGSPSISTCVRGPPPQWTWDFEVHRQERGRAKGYSLTHCKKKCVSPDFVCFLIWERSTFQPLPPTWSMQNTFRSNNCKNELSQGQH